MEKRPDKFANSESTKLHSKLSTMLKKNQMPIQPKQSHNEAGEHGLICQDGCDCPIMNGAPIYEDIKIKLWSYMKRCSKIVSSKVLFLKSTSVIIYFYYEPIKIKAD